MYLILSQAWFFSKKPIDLRTSWAWCWKELRFEAQGTSRDLVVQLIEKSRASLAAQRSSRLGRPCLAERLAVQGGCVPRQTDGVAQRQETIRSFDQTLEEYDESATVVRDCPRIGVEFEYDEVLLLLSPRLSARGARN